jgi:hypothetical protein
VEWPLTEVLHARAMATYSAVWRVLLRVRRAGVTLASAWLRLASLSRSLHCTGRGQARSPLADVHAGRLSRVQLFVAEATHFHRLVASFFTTQLLGVRTPPARPARRTHLSLGEMVRAQMLGFHGRLGFRYGTDKAPQPGVCLAGWTVASLWSPGVINAARHYCSRPIVAWSKPPGYGVCENPNTVVAP